MSVILKPAFKKLISRRRLLSVSKLNVVMEKMSWSGLNEIVVPVFSVCPIASSRAWGTPFWYSW